MSMVGVKMTRKNYMKGLTSTVRRVKEILQLDNLQQEKLL